MFLASKPGTSSKTAVNLNLPPPRSSTNIQTEAMDVAYGPALPPRLVLDQQDTSDQYFYCVNTSYPMDNSLSGRRRPARQTSEKDVLCLHRPGRSSAVHSPGGV